MYGTLCSVGKNIGGMIGNSYTQNITNSVASCTILMLIDPNSNNSISNGYVGGLIGVQQGDNYNITNCNVSTNIYSETNSIGGMFGYCKGSGVISYCQTLGKVKTEGNISGGFAGSIGSNVTVRSCISSAQALAVGLMAGGFVATNFGTIELSIASGAGACGKGDIGGFAGTNSGNISKCSSNQVVLLFSENESAAIAGGFVGQNLSSISNCCSLGSVGYSLGDPSKFTAYTGSFVGHNMESAVITNSYALGNSVCSFSWCGGIAGCNEGNISNCVALGKIINASQKTGRITGENTGTITNCFAASHMTINDITPSSNIGTNKINGETVGVSSYQTKNWWLNTVGFDSSIWSYSNTNNRMELNNMP